MHVVIIALGLVLPCVVQGVQGQSFVVQGVQDLRGESDDHFEYPDLDQGSDNYVINAENHTTTAKPKNHVHPLVLASDLNYTDLCKCFSKNDVSQDCRQRYPDNLRTLRNGFIQMVYVTDDESLNSFTSPLILISSGQQTNLTIENEVLVLLCESSIGSSMDTLHIHHISRLHINGQILQNRSNPIHLTFNIITTPIRFREGSLKLLPSAADNNSTKVSLSFNHISEVVFESNSVVVPDLILNAGNVDLLKFETEAITLTSQRPFPQLRVKGSRTLTMETNSIIYVNVEVALDGCAIDNAYPVVELELIGQASLAENSLKLLPCTNLTLRKVNLSHAGPKALTNLPKAMLNRVHILGVTGNGGLARGSICLMANTVWAANNLIFSHEYEDVEDVIWLAGKSVQKTGESTGILTCEQPNAEVLDTQECQICQVNKASNSTRSHMLLHDTENNPTTTVASTTSHVLIQEEPPHHEVEDKSFNLLDHKMVVLYLVVAASIIVLAIIAAFIIHAINKRKKRMSWKVPSLPWAKSHHNSRHPALAAKAAYRASQNISGKPECYTIFDSIAAAKQVKQKKPSHQNAKENHPIEEKQDQQECTYSEPTDTITSSRRHSHVYAYPSNIKGGEGSIDRYSSLSDRRLSASTASVASSIANLNMISALSIQDRRKSSFGLLIDITSALGIESNYKQLTNK